MRKSRQLLTLISFLSYYALFAVPMTMPKRPMPPPQCNTSMAARVRQRASAVMSCSAMRAAAAQV